MIDADHLLYINVSAHYVLSLKILGRLTPSIQAMKRKSLQLRTTTIANIMMKTILHLLPTPQAVPTIPRTTNSLHLP